MTISRLTNCKWKLLKMNFTFHFVVIEWKKWKVIIGVKFFLFSFWINANCNITILTFNFHFCRKTRWLMAVTRNGRTRWVHGLLTYNNERLSFEKSLQKNGSVHENCHKVLTREMLQVSDSIMLARMIVLLATHRSHLYFLWLNFWFHMKLRLLYTEDLKL